MGDATFADGAPDRPLRLWATDAEDLQVVAALCQDAVLPASEMRWIASERRFAMLLNRFRWEDRRDAERVRSVLVVSDVTRVGGQGITPGDPDTILSLLTLEWEPGEDGQGALILTFAGDGAVRVEAECLDIRLSDVTRPYAAPSGKAPDHDA
ncbi:DUF2948 family protein [Jannaschia aquimarina]|uniref:DUF2948 domain-containing protein n=1 Tax=Jannaschia aquimarina TaxID=935700 RepID=A0A0D1EGU4_9RHOB|nr:DUF2948 family protein [Jannaschia aquimarina]KIT16819.1 hypothetical protein jaqu_13140 [Jannaschia aquimarina]SNT13605.1 Protein of unknown function [Jannaschia aquimarina]